MKKIVLSSLACFALASGLSATQFYVDDKGQVFTTSAPGRVALDNEKKSTFNSITIENPKSPDFLLGKETHVNMKFVANDNPNMWLKAGVRLQSSFESLKTDYVDPTKSDTDIVDAYMRRLRFEVAAGFNKWTSFVMDIRNDRVNQLQRGEGTFTVGDAYLDIEKPFTDSLVNFRLFRAKIDVSRTETVKSGHTIIYDRPQVADYAANFISHNRRATNAQVYGDWNKKVHYQLAFGDATDASTLQDSQGKATSSISEQSFFYGGKIRLSPFDGWEEKSRTETYFGQGKHFSVGASYWCVPEIKGHNAHTSKGSFDLKNELVNLELSAHYKGFFVQGEYFDFDGVVKNWADQITSSGKSTGWYVTSEYVMPDLWFIAPFVRYESWDKYKDAQGDFDYTSKVAGINWYLKGNSIKAGIAYQKDEYGANIGNKDVDSIRITSQFFF